MRVKIATWNVNGIRARQTQLQEFIEREQPDVLCLQEIKASPDQLPVWLGELEGYWVDLQAGSQRDARPHATGVVEHVLVVSGTIEITVEDETTTVSAGDRLTFTADRPHRYRAIDGPARSLTLIDYPA